MTSEIALSLDCVNDIHVLGALFSAVKEKQLGIPRLSDYDASVFDAAYCLDAPEFLPAGGCFFGSYDYTFENAVLDQDGPCQLVAYRY